MGKSFDVAVPLCAEIAVNGNNNHSSKLQNWWLAVVGRLQPGWTLKRASAQLQAISPAVFETTVPPSYLPDMAKAYAKYKLTAIPGQDGISSLRENYQEPLLLLLSIAGLVLLIACANLANLMLARASVREREMAVRLAIGADRLRLVRQLLIESFALAIIGATAGVLLAHFLSESLVSFLSTGDDPVFVHLGLDWRLLAFTAGLTILTCLLFGLTPALRATRTNPAAAMKAAGRSVTADRQRFGVRRALVVSQMALSLVLLVGALLFIGSLRHLMTVDAGFRRDGLLVASIDASRLPFSPARRSTLYRALLEDVQRVTGVLRASSALIVPLSGSGWNNIIEIGGVTQKKNMVPYFNRVSVGYFRTMGTPLLAGRSFEEHDTQASPEVAIVSKTFCDKFLGKLNPLGRQIHIVTGPGEPQHTYQIIGEVADSKYRSLKDDFIPVVFVAQNQDKEARAGINLMVRPGLPLGSLMPALTKAILARNAGLSFEFQVFQTQISDSLVRERLMAALSGFFGFLAAVLATVGLYGVISFMVARRRAEIGIRMALGATRQQIIKLVAREAGLLLGLGLIVGTALAIAAGRTAGAFLYGLKPNDPAVIVSAVLALRNSGRPRQHPARDTCRPS